MGAFTYEKLGQSEKALELIQAHLEGDIDLQFFAARVHAAQGDIESASEIYANLEKERPGQFLEPWGTLLADMGESQKALVVWSQLPEKMGQTVDSYTRWGRLLSAKGYLEEAQSAFRQGIERTGKDTPRSDCCRFPALATSKAPHRLSTLREQTRQNQMIWTPEFSGNLQTQRVESFFAALGEMPPAEQPTPGGGFRSGALGPGSPPKSWRPCWLVESPLSPSLHWNPSQEKRLT
jgi:tetratricopeptide (TPR) repeat protein